MENVKHRLKTILEEIGSIIPYGDGRVLSSSSARKNVNQDLEKLIYSSLNAQSRHNIKSCRPSSRLPSVQSDWARVGGSNGVFISPKFDRHHYQSWPQNKVSIITIYELLICNNMLTLYTACHPIHPYDAPQHPDEVYAFCCSEICTCLLYLQDAIIYNPGSYLYARKVCVKGSPMAEIFRASNPRVANYRFR